ncbi:MAG: siderophore-interacting protein, partial [Actinomycetes bacterium]
MTEVSTTRPVGRETSRLQAAQPAAPVAVQPILAYRVAVTRVERISSNFQRVTFGGACLADFGVQGPTLDLRIKVMIPPAGGESADLGALMDGEGTGWYQQWLSLDPAERGDMRTYTVRESRCDQEVPELDVDFVMHFDAEGRG